MSFLLSLDQEDFRASLRRYLADVSPEERVRLVMAGETGFDRDVWRGLADRMGLQALAIPESRSGAGFSVTEAAVAAGELGRALTCVPYLSTVGLAAPLLERCGGAVADDWLPRIAAGEAVIAVALSASWEDGLGVATVSVDQADDEVRMRGRVPFVLDGHVADLLLVATPAGSGTALWAVERAADGVTTTPVSSLDATRRLASVTFDGSPATPVGGPDVQRALDHAVAMASVCLAAEQVGGASRVLELSLEHARVREQFGRPIATFQAIRHRLADMYLAVESARSLAQHAAAMAASGHEVSGLASVALSFASRTYCRVAEEAIQVHGAVGFSWEHPVHLYFKRARQDAQLLGGAVWHRARAAECAGV